MSPTTETPTETRWWPSPFGADDQLGMLNHIDEAKRRDALALVREGRLFDLGRVLDETVPVFPGRYFRQTLVTTAHHSNADGGVGENRVNRLGAETIPQIVTRGWLVDAAGNRGVERLETGTVIGLDDVAGIEPEPGDAVLFHTGWGAHWADPPSYLQGEPGPGLAVARWIAEHGVALTGCRGTTGGWSSPIAMV